MDYLEHQLIPDLEESGMTATAEDFKTTLVFIANPARKSGRLSGPLNTLNHVLQWSKLLQTIKDGKRVQALADRFARQQTAGFKPFAGPKSKLP